MRKLMWFVIGYTAGIAVGIWLFGGLPLLIAAGVLLAAALLMGILRSPGNIRKAAALCMAGTAVAMCCFFLYEQRQLEKPRSFDGQFMELTVEVTDYGTVNTNGSSASGVIDLEGSRCKVKFYIDEEIALVPGDLVSGLFYMRFTGYGARMSPTYHQGEGIYLLAYSEGESDIEQDDLISGRYFTAQLRLKLQDMLDQIFPEDTAGFAGALLLGDTSKLSEADDNGFQNSGIRHIIAVSGLHVSILFSFVYQLVGKRKWLTAILGLPALLLFAALAGFTPSVIRACVMQGLMILAMLFEKEYDPPTALSFAVLVILGINPMALTSISFQLSVGCVIGIFLFSSRINRYIISRKWIGDVSGKSLRAKLARWFSQSVSVSLGAISLTTPLSAYYFGAVSTVSVLTNLLTLWVISYIFCGIIISLAAGFIFLPAGNVLAWLVAWPMRYVLGISKLIARIPYSMISAENVYIVAWLLFCYVLVILTLCSKHKRPLAVVGCMVAGLSFALLFSALEARQDHFRMTVLNVGQGQCIILQSGDGCYVVDCGGSSGDGAADLAVQTLRTQSIERIDGLILTHYDKDHAGGVESFMSQLPVDTLYLPDVEPEEELRLDLESQFADKIHWVRRNEYIAFGHAFMSLYPADMNATGNNSSTSILFQAENCDILITGDLNTEGEQELLRSVRLPELEILVAGHHGAESSSSMYLLDALRPKAAVISVGKDNTYGHPSRETLGRLELFGCRVWRTDLNGTVVFRG